jgi:hypothetical protein
MHSIETIVQSKSQAKPDQTSPDPNISIRGYKILYQIQKTKSFILSSYGIVLKEKRKKKGKSPFAKAQQACLKEIE